MAYAWDSQNIKTYNNRTGRYKFDVEYKFILAQLGNSRRKLLDIGGGSGRFALPLSKLIAEVVVVDPNLDALEILKSRIFSENIKLYHGTLSDYVEGGDFDLVIIIEVLGMIENITEFFMTIAKITFPEAIVILTVANPKSWRFTLKKIMLLFGRNYYPYNFITIEKLERIITSSNFKILEKKGFNWIPLPLSSDSIFVNLFVQLEKLLGLSKWINQSPWVLIAAQKNKI
jgi:2-polyprenyl-3-methyl-5-hydroxy-6-metoxy-1,4-benzoquinol methylase